MRSRWPSVARQLSSEVPDAELLERYALQQCNESFAQLVSRYSRLVWGQCRNLLPNDADADDAFQATFLTLARSVRKLKPGAPLGPWLHGVAYRVCKNAQRANARRTTREKASAKSEAARPVADSTWESAFAAVAEEVHKLPEAQRLAFVLCGLEGRSEGEAAAALGQKVGTISSRLARAKRTLLDRLAHRGFGAGVLALGGVTGSVAVAPAALVARALALLPSNAVVPSSIQYLMHGVTGMALIRFKVLAAGVLVATGLSLSIGGGWQSSATAQAPAAGNALPPRNEPAAKDPADITQLKAELERAKAALAKAEEESSRFVYDYYVNAPDARYAKTPAKFEYEPIPKAGYSVKAFEAKVEERARVGWQYLGTNPIQGKDGVASPTMVFRWTPKEADTLFYRSLTNPAVAPPAKVASPETAPMIAFPAKAPEGLSPVDPAPKLELPLPKTVEGITVGGDWEHRLRELDYQAKIAALEKEIQALKLGVPLFKLQGPSSQGFFYKNDFGDWDNVELAEVLKKALSNYKPESKTFKIEANVEGEPLRVTGSQADIAKVAEWVKKLKK